MATWMVYTFMVILFVFECPTGGCCKIKKRRNLQRACTLLDNHFALSHYNQSAKVVKVQLRMASSKMARSSCKPFRSKNNFAEKS